MAAGSLRSLLSVTDMARIATLKFHIVLEEDIQLHNEPAWLQAV